MNRTAALFAVFGLLIPGAFAQTPPDSVSPEAIDALFAAWAAEDSPGAAVAVIRDGEMLYSQGYGCAQLEYGVPITNETVFHVASVSKQFTAAAICLLAEDGVLSLDDPIQRWVPSVPDFGTPITLRHLLTHTSGMRDQWEMLAISGVRYDDVITTRHILDMVGRQRELNFPPGERYLYCNTGFTLLAEAVSRASGKPFREFCEERIFAPLQMTGTHFHDDHQEIVPRRAYSYERDIVGLEKSVLSFGNVGATSLFTTAEDLATWMWGLFAGEVGGGGITFQMLTPGRLNDGSELPYGLGLSLNPHRGLETFGHGGSDAGFRSDVLFLPELGMGFVVVSNFGNFSPRQLTRQVADLYLGHEVTPTVMPIPAESPVTPQETTVTKRVVVAAETLAAVAGWYDLGNLVAQFHVEGRRLFVSHSGESARILTARSELGFSMAEAEFEFQREGTGPVDVVAVTVGPVSLEGQRIQPGEVDLGPYVGRYFSEEAGTYYDLVDEDGLMIARHVRHGSFLLSVESEDRFRGDRSFFGDVRFARSEAGEITGFRLSGGRVLNLWFERD